MINSVGISCFKYLGFLEPIKKNIEKRDTNKIDKNRVRNKNCLVFQSLKKCSWRIKKFWICIVPLVFFEALHMISFT